MLRILLLALIAICAGCETFKGERQDDAPGGIYDDSDEQSTALDPPTDETVEPGQSASSSAGAERYPTRQHKPASLPSYRGQSETRARTAESYSGPAVLSLLKQSKTALSKGRNDQASAALERALRIEPKNPFVWQALAAVHLNGKRAQQAEATAEKSISLAQGNPHVAAGSWRLISQARTMLGNKAGAAEALQKANELKDSN